MKNDSGKLIVFEGSDEVGKSTLIREIASSLSTDVEVLAFPGNLPSTLGKWFYDFQVVNHQMAWKTNLVMI